jgi:hypothetical protein
MKASSLLLHAALAGGLLAGAVGSASAASPPTKPAKESCFMSTQWAGWKAPNDKTIYLRVNLHDIYRVDLSGSSPLLTWPDTHLVNIEHGTDLVCSPLDLQLSVAESGGGGAREFLIAKAITKLTPDEIAAIPKKDLP